MHLYQFQFSSPSIIKTHYETDYSTSQGNKMEMQLNCKQLQNILYLMMDNFKENCITISLDYLLFYFVFYLAIMICFKKDTIYNMGKKYAVFPRWLYTYVSFLPHINIHLRDGYSRVKYIIYSTRIEFFGFY